MLTSSLNEKKRARVKNDKMQKMIFLLTTVSVLTHPNRTEDSAAGRDTVGGNGACGGFTKHQSESRQTGKCSIIACKLSPMEQPGSEFT